MDYLPIFLDIKNRPCAVIGGNEQAFNKSQILQSAGCQLTVIANELCGHFQSQVETHQITYVNKPFHPEMLDVFELVIVASDDENLKKTVVDAANERKIPINVVDDPELCSFIMPSIIDRSPLVVAISTSGTSPTLGRMIRSKIESMLPQSYGRLTQLIGTFREKSKLLYQTALERRKFWDKILASNIMEIFLSGKEDEAKIALEKEFEKPQKDLKKYGQVCLVGAGPGDPDLLTMKALRLIQNADAIVYDRLVAPKTLKYARRDAEMIYVGKKKSSHTVPQEEINQKLVDLAKEGKTVVRLKGGDPFIFGRGGEELEKLIEDQVYFQVVPGVTSASGCGTYAGIPLTHRDYAQSCVLVTGHLKEGKLALNWQGLVQPNQTVVFYMGLSNVEVLSAELIKHGMSKEMPAAIIQKGTTRNQKVYKGSLEKLPQIVADNDIAPPSLIIIGEVVKLHDKLAWFSSYYSDDIKGNALFD
jgi:uroporphyrin-III C-methyltransferase / precorrin-2 dehydrogenase / sirohydrochlorin ferrochelatase